MDLNVVTLGGNLTRDPESRHLGGETVCQLGLAINRNYTDRDGQRQEETCFVDVEVWGRQADSCVEYLERGAPVIVQGALKYDSWEDRESGARRSKLMVKATRVQFLGRIMGDDSGDDRRGRDDRSRSRGRQRRDDDRGARRDDRSRGRDDDRGARRGDSRRTDDRSRGRRGDERRGGGSAPPPPPFPSGGSRAASRGSQDSVDDIPF